MPFFQLESRAGKIDETMLDARAFEGDAPVNLAYPSDLFSDNASYGNAYTAFFISVHADEELAKVTDLTVDTYYTKDRKSGALAQASQENGKNTVSATMGATAFIATALGALKVSSAPTLRKYATAGGLGAVAAFATMIGGNNTAFKQQKACIILPTPNLDSNYNFSWESNSNAMMGGIIESVGDTVNNPSLGGMWNKVTGWAQSLVQRVPLAGDTVSRLSGYSPNPRKEQVFREPSFRQFNFNYTFAPRSEEEARNVEAIIRQFKYHAHPSLNESDFCYRYPSEFDIVHYHNGVENLHLPKHTTSVLESVGVNYAPSDNYSFFSNGMPSVIQLSLRFLELAIVTKEDIRKGY